MLANVLSLLLLPVARSK